ncbi:hypothetical protein GGR51DRAFT_159643 [Nemania sp. FL0031]|nr:hypothetical protein GGR51DRAFT_159643 [Nemania sp. FL0031]
MSPTNGSRPARLRSACNNCHAAKTKCSGQKTGCDRCTAFEVPCKYEISMVGKVSGARAKNRRRPDSSPGSAEPATGAGTIPFELPEPSPQVPDTPANIEPSSMLSPPSNSMSAWDLPFDFAENSEPTTQTNIDMAMPGTTGLEHIPAVTTKRIGEMDNMWYGQLESLPSLPTSGDQNPDDFLAALRASPPKRYRTSESIFSGQSTQPGDMPDVERSELEYIARCSEIIGAVERTLNYKSCTLDQVLGACKRHVKSLVTIINHDEFEFTIGCRTVILTALNLIITLLERCLKADESKDISPSSASDDGERLFQFRFSLPRVSFGSLHYDNGEQFAFCSHLMQAELSRILAVLNTLKRRTPSGICRGSTSAGHIQEVWCGDFQKRLTELSNMLSKVRGSSSS